MYMSVAACGGCTSSTAADSAGADGLLALELLHEDNPSAACVQ